MSRLKFWLSSFLTLSCFLAPASSFGASSGFLEEDNTPTVEQKATIVKPDEKKTEAAFCPDGKCKKGISNNPTPEPIDTSKVLNSEERTACYSKIILSTAKTKVAKWYGNRGHSVGDCAKGVRSILGAAGFNPLGALGDAYHFKRDGKLKALGFKDIYYPGMRPDQAPPGAVLVFRGDFTLSTNGVLPPRRKRRGMGAGNWVGHVTIKGDDGFYYTDGRTRSPAVPRRYLVGVYVPNNCDKCSAGVKRRCGG